MITVRTVKDRAELDPATQARLRAIHEAAFPPEERQYAMDHMIRQAGPPGRILRIVRSGEAVAGYAYLELAPEVATAFLWYIAIDAGLRDQGLGRLTMLDTLETLRRDQPAVRLVMFEVHKPAAHHDPAEQELDRRRIEFYRRLGAWWVRDVDYRIPAAGDPGRGLAYDPMFIALRGEFREDEVRSSVLAMAADNFEGRPADPRWLSLQASVGHLTIVAPPAGADLPSGVKAGQAWSRPPGTPPRS